MGLEDRTIRVILIVAHASLVSARKLPVHFVVFFRELGERGNTRALSREP